MFYLAGVFKNHSQILSLHTFLVKSCQNNALFLDFSFFHYQFHILFPKLLKQFLGNIPFIFKQIFVRISPCSLITKWSLKPWNQPAELFPLMAIPRNTLFCWILWLSQTSRVVESTKLIPVHGF